MRRRLLFSWYCALLCAVGVVSIANVSLANGSGDKARKSSSTRQQNNASASTASGFDWLPWQRILQRYRSSSGVRYKALRGSSSDRAQLQALVEAIGHADVSNMARNERLAFYVNAYNVLTVASVVELWPIKSVKKVEGPDFFKGRAHRVAGRSMTLDTLENQLIRKEFREPRIHFALNCASKGCPPLRGRPYSASGLSGQLEAQTRSFLREDVRVAGNKVYVSMIFKWFAKDFGGEAGVRRFIAKRLRPADAEVLRRPGTALVYEHYNWKLNGH